MHVIYGLNNANLAFLAGLYERTGKLLLSWALEAQFKVLHKSFLCDRQGTVRQAILYVIMSLYFFPFVFEKFMNDSVNIQCMNLQDYEFSV